MPEGVPFGSYLLLRRLARGGMAEVFLARQQGPEGFARTVALKRILPHLADAPEFCAMFLDEARLAARLSHPNVAHIYELGAHEGQYFIAMEYIDGIDLARLLRQAATDPLPFSVCARIIADVCAGLHHAHTLANDDGTPLGLVHRDVSPQNVLVSRAGVAKLVDFGIAKAAVAAERTRPGIIKGKFAYLSPEQIAGAPLDARSDVWSVGVLLHQILAGAALFDHHDAARAMDQIQRGAIPSLASRRPDLPRDLAAILARSLTVRRDDRYESAAAMALDLEGFLKNGAELCTAATVAATIRPLFDSEPRSTPPSTARPADGDTPSPSLETAPVTAATSSRAAIVSVDLLAAAVATPGDATKASRPAPYRSRGRWLGVAVTAAAIASGALFVVLRLRTVHDAASTARSSRLPKRVTAAPPGGADPLLPIAVPATDRPAVGYLTLATRPPSEVFEGRRDLGAMPLTALPLPPGPHQLDLAASGRRPIRAIVVVEAGRILRADFSLP